jgi:glycine C-acetyltransferase
MDGDIIDFPRLVELCRKYRAWLMIDEAHSLGVLGQTGRGIEEHFNLPGTIDIKMGTLSKTIPSIGGYIAGSLDLIRYLRHTARAYIFSAALPPAQAAAAKVAFEVILDEPWRVEKINSNSRQFIQGLQQRGFNTLHTQTAIVPVICGEDETARDDARGAASGCVCAASRLSGRPARIGSPAGDCDCCPRAGRNRARHGYNPGSREEDWHPLIRSWS